MPNVLLRCYQDWLPDFRYGNKNVSHLQKKITEFLKIGKKFDFYGISIKIGVIFRI